MKVWPLIVAAFLAGCARAQLPLMVRFPEGSVLELSTDAVVFDLGRQGFPPRRLPAYYPPTGPGTPVTLRLYSNLEGSWALVAEMTALTREDGRWLPASRLEVRLDGGPWLALGKPVTLWVGQGPTQGYHEFRLEFRLRVEGDEQPGRYRGALLLRLSRL